MRRHSGLRGLMDGDGAEERWEESGKRERGRMLKEQVTKKNRVRLEERFRKSKEKKEKEKEKSIQNQTGFFNGATPGKKSEPSGEP